MATANGTHVQFDFPARFDPATLGKTNRTFSVNLVTATLNSVLRAGETSRFTIHVSVFARAVPAAVTSAVLDYLRNFNAASQVDFNTVVDRDPATCTFSISTGSVSTSPAGVFTSVTVNGGAITKLIDGTPARYLTVAGGFVYASSGAAGEVDGVSEQGGAREVFAAGLSGAGEIYADANQIYFSVPDNCSGNGLAGVMDLATRTTRVLKTGLI